MDDDGEHMRVNPEEVAQIYGVGECKELDNQRENQT